MTLTPQPDFAPLAGISVLDFSHVIAGPFATFLLAQLGAQVTKVESAGGGDVMRRAGKGHAAFVALNAGKSSLALDLSDDAGREHALELAGRCDVFVDNLRPGVLERFGLCCASATSEPDLMYCCTDAAETKARGIWPPSASVTAGPPPR